MSLSAFQKSNLRIGFGISGSAGPRPCSALDKLDKFFAHQSDTIRIETEV